MSEGVKHTVLVDGKSTIVDNLLSIYEKNPYEARIIYLNTRKKIQVDGLALWEHDNGKVELSHYVKTYGIGVTNRLYTRYTKVQSFIYKDKKFYLRVCDKGKAKLFHLTWYLLEQFVHKWGKHSGLRMFFDDLFAKHSWIRFIAENPVFHGVALNTFVRHRLYNRNDALKKILKVPLPVALKLVDAVGEEHHKQRLVKVWKEVSKVVTNVENLRVEILQNPMFMDACRMASVVGEKINLAWSDSRFKEEHDRYSQIITDTIFNNIEERPLRVSQVFVDFCNMYGYRLITTNRELYAEGRNQRHCVGTYEYRISRGDTAIFRYEGYTGELYHNAPRIERVDYKAIGDHLEEHRKPKTIPGCLQLAQFRGYKNKTAPTELTCKVQDDLYAFNELYRETAAAWQITTQNLAPSMSNEEWFANPENENEKIGNIFRAKKRPPVDIIDEEAGMILGRDNQEIQDFE